MEDGVREVMGRDVRFNEAVLAEWRVRVYVWRGVREVRESL